MSPSVFYSLSLLLLAEVGRTDTQDSDKDGDYKLHYIETQCASDTQPVSMVGILKRKGLFLFAGSKHLPDKSIFCIWF